jgi:spore coat polysaccharide biosynthesis protein SpsF
MIVAIIQARMNSSRLPGKVMLTACEKPLLLHQIERMKDSKTIDKIVIATSVKKEDDVIKDFCEENNIMCIRGSENDLLSRYKMAADETQADVVVRLTSDTPLLEYNVIDKVVNVYTKNKYDFVSNCYPLPRTYPDGMNIEVFSKKILDEMYFNAKKPSEREHVTFYVLAQPKKFNIFRVDNIKDVSDYRFNLDYELDYELIREVFNNLYKDGQIFLLEDIIKFLEKNPKILKINSEIEPYKGILNSFEEDTKMGFKESENFFMK